MQSLGLRWVYGKKKCHEVICVNPPYITYNFISPVALLFLDQDLKLTMTYFIN